MNIGSKIILPIVLSIIGSFIFYVMLLVAKKYGEKLVILFSRVSRNFSNRLYKRLASGHSFDAIYPFLLLIPVILLANVVILQGVEYANERIQGVMTVTLKNQYMDDLETVYKQLVLVDSSNIKKTDSIIASNPKRYFEQQKNELTKLKAGIEGHISSLKLGNEYDTINNIVTITIYLLVFIVLIILMIRYFMYQFISNQTRYFEKKLIFLRPHITEKEYYGLKQKWLLIKSIEDFNELNKTLEEFFKKFDLKMDL